MRDMDEMPLQQAKFVRQGEAADAMMGLHEDTRPRWYGYCRFCAVNTRHVRSEGHANELLKEHAVTEEHLAAVTRNLALRAFMEDMEPELGSVRPVAGESA